jgi:hypothetical protein
MLWVCSFALSTFISFHCAVVGPDDQTVFEALSEEEQQRFTNIFHHLFHFLHVSFFSSSRYTLTHSSEDRNLRDIVLTSDGQVGFHPPFFDSFDSFGSLWAPIWISLQFQLMFP